MQLNQTWDTLSRSLLSAAVERPAAQIEGGSGQSARSQGSWHALFSDRSKPLLVPADNAAAQHTSLRFFIADTSHLLYAKAALAAHKLFKHHASLPQVSLPDIDRPTLIDQFAAGELSEAAFMIRHSGACQSASMLLMSKQGEPQMVVKIAINAEADRLINREVDWLRNLRTMPELDKRIPELLRYGSARNNRHYLVTAVLPGAAGDTVFTAAHAQFLQSLAAARPRQSRWLDAPMANHLADGLQQLQPGTGERVHAELCKALAECAQILGDQIRPWVIANGDFAPWNIRGSDPLAAADWECAFEGASPLFDVFHFLIAPRTANGRRVGAKLWKNALAQAQAYARSAYPEQEWTAATVAAHGLAYLLHGIVSYSLPEGEVLEQHPMIEAHLKLIKEREQWVRWSE